MLDKMGHGLVLTGKVTDSRVFILTREAAVAFNISTEDSGELAFKTLFSHGITFLLSLKGNGERQ